MHTPEEVLEKARESKRNYYNTHKEEVYERRRLSQVTPEFRAYRREKYRKDQDAKRAQESPIVEEEASLESSLQVLHSSDDEKNIW